MSKTDKQIEALIDDLGLNYLDFQNNGRQYEESVRVELRAKLNTLIKPHQEKNEDLKLNIKAKIALLESEIKLMGGMIPVKGTVRWLKTLLR